MTFESWFTLAVVAGTIIAFVAEAASIDAVVLVALTLLMMAGVLPPAEALGGFGSVAVLTVAALLVVAAGVRRTGLLNVVADRLFGRNEQREPLWRMMLPAGVLSAFMNNTPIVAMFTPTILDWCKRKNIAPSRMLMPLSFSTMLGGMCTLIGTAGTLVVDGLMRENGMPGLDMFEIAAVGVPTALGGMAVIWLLASRVLPDRRDPVTRLGAERREFLVEMLVQPGSPLVGQTIEGVGLRNLGGLFLMNVARDGTFVGPVSPAFGLRGNDRLVFTGVASTVVELRRFPGLTPAPEAHYDPTAAERRDRLYEVVVSPRSPLVGTTIKDVGFRSRYDAAVLAVHRAGQRLETKLGEVELRPGDTLMIEAHRDFAKAWEDSLDFMLISKVRADARPKIKQGPGALLIVAVMVTAVSLKWVPMVVAAFAAVLAMLAMRLLTPREAHRAVDLRVIVVYGGAIGLGRALQTSGAADALGGHIVAWAPNLGGRELLALVFVVTALLASYVNNVASAAIVFPIVIAAASQAGLNPRPFAIVVALAASSSFATPVGTQPNLIIYGPGGYRFTDFLRLGLPVQLTVLIIVVLLVPAVWPLR